MNNKENLVKVAKIGYIVSKVFYIIACVACLAGLVLAIVLPLTAPFFVTDSKIPPMQFCAMFIDMALVSFFAIGILWNVQMWCKSIRDEGSPFTEKLPKYLNKMGIITILASTVPAIVSTAVIQSTIRDSELVFNVGTGGIVSGIILILASYFFKYGAKLQKMDNETL